MALQTVGRISRPEQFYIDAWDGYHNLLTNITDKSKCDIAVMAFEQAQLSHPEVVLSGCMTNRKYALSYMTDDVKRKIDKINGILQQK